MTIKLATEVYEEVMEDDEVWKGYSTLVTDENENLIASFHHQNFRDRILWSKGFFAAIKYKEPWSVDKWYNPDWKDPELELDGNVDVGDWVVSNDDKVMRVDMDSQPDLPFERIKRFATKGEAKNAKEINELVQELKREKASNLAAWNMYGSELCAGDMSRKEKAIEDKIKELKEEECQPQV